MPSSEQAALLRAAMNMEPKDAVAYFRSKGYRVTDQWQEMEGRAHARAFTVAKAASMDVLEIIRKGIDKALAEGTTEETFVKDVAPLLQKAGWWGKETRTDAQGNDYEVQLGSPWRLKNIYRINLATAYNVGRYRRQLAAVEFRPYWQYIAVLDNETRPTHRLLANRVFRWDDPIWSVIYPPNGWGCRCRVRNLTERNLTREGLEVENGLDWIETIEREAGIDYQTGEVIKVQHNLVRLPDGSVMSPDIGWDHNPGSAAFGVDASIARSIGQLNHTGLRAQVISAMNNEETRHEQFAQWMAEALAKSEAGPDNPQGRSAKNWQPVLFMPESTALELEKAVKLAGADPVKILPGRLVVMNEKQVGHMDRDAHPQISQATYLNLSRLMAQPRAVLWELDKNRLIYVLTVNGDEAEVAVVGLNETLEKSLSSVVERLITTYVRKVVNLQDEGVYKKLEGKW